MMFYVNINTVDFENTQFFESINSLNSAYAIFFLFLTNNPGINIIYYYFSGITYAAEFNIAVSVNNINVKII